VTIKANGGARAEARVGQPISFSGTISAPPGAGAVVKAEWDFEGKGDFPVKSAVTPDKASAAVRTTYSFSRPGTYFATLRGYTQRQGDKTTPFARIRNLARARVVVR
jgi:hypothetical protein